MKINTKRHTVKVISDGNRYCELNKSEWRDKGQATEEEGQSEQGGWAVGAGRPTDGKEVVCAHLRMRNGGKGKGKCTGSACIMKAQNPTGEGSLSPL